MKCEWMNGTQKMIEKTWTKSITSWCTVDSGINS